MFGHWLALVLLAFLNLLLFPYFLFLIVTALAASFARPEKLANRTPRSKFLIAIPAHDEQTEITATVESCLASDYPSELFSVMVIADNCSDSTAALAAKAGAHVLERFDPVRKSKGYAIEYMIDDITAAGTLDALHAIVIIDADTTIDRALLRCFDQDLQAGRDWIQCYYSVAQPERSWRTRLMAYAFSLFNGVIPLGQCTLGSSATLHGNGMCFSTRGLKRRPWSSYGLVEDMDYSWSLRIAGEPVAFQRRAAVYGAIPSAGGAPAANQRRRWEFGRGEVRRRYLPSLLRTDQIGWWQKLLSFLELTVPALAWLFLLFVVAVSFDLQVFFTPGGAATGLFRWLLLGNAIFMTISLCTYAISPFVAMGLPPRYVTSLPLFPVYLCWRLLISLGGRPKEWVRTARES
jgi:cellulose synthase/poly-beta-1,6-N-acetylglucosamine synthase-like glycosyltransferase